MRLNRDQRPAHVNFLDNRGGETRPLSLFALAYTTLDDFRKAGTMPRGKNTEQATIYFSPQGYKLLQDVAEAEGIAITDYIRRLIAADMQNRGFKVTEADLRSGKW